MYITCEQSRKPRVKCRPNGELRDGRRIDSAMGLPHPLLHIGTLPYVATILGRAKGRLFIYLSLLYLYSYYSLTVCRGVFAFMCSQEFSAVGLPDTKSGRNSMKTTTIIGKH